MKDFIKKGKGLDVPAIIMNTSFATLFGLLFFFALSAVCLLGYVHHLFTAFASGVIAFMCIREIYKEIRSIDDRSADSNIGASKAQCEILKINDHENKESIK